MIAFVVEPQKDSAWPFDLPLSLLFYLGGYHSTTMELEAMQVQSMCMLCKEDDASPNMNEYIESVVLAEDVRFDLRILEVFQCS